MRLVTIGGATGVGKSTLCRGLSVLLGNQAKCLRVPYWPSFSKYLQETGRYAFENQFEAMSAISSAIDRTMTENEGVLLADTDPVRVHLVHSWLMHVDGLFTDGQWLELCDQYKQEVKHLAGPYLILDASAETARKRILSRGRSEDMALELSGLARTVARWGELQQSHAWALDRTVISIDAESSIDAVRTQVMELLADWHSAEGGSGVHSESAILSSHVGYRAIDDGALSM